VGEQPERDQRPDDRQAGERERRRRAGRGQPRSALEGGRERQREERAAEQLDGGDGGRVATAEQPRLDHYERRRHGRRREHQEVAVDSRAAPGTGAGDRCDAEQGERVATPGARSGGGIAEPRPDQRDEHRDRPDQHGRVADAGPLHPRVLEHDHRAEADRTADRDPRIERLAQPAAAGQGQRRRRCEESGGRQPAGPEPAQRELRQWHRQAPHDTGRGQRQDCVAVFVVHTNNDRSCPATPETRLDRSA
jgi:hypothetical protein